MPIKDVESIIRTQEILSFELDNGERCEAFPVQVAEDGVIYIFVDCLAEEMYMNTTDTTKGGYEESFMRKYLNTEVLGHFPEKLRKSMVPVNALGDLLTIPSRTEIFGDNDGQGQWPAMKLRRNRIAFQGLNGDWEYWWLRGVVSAAYFASVYSNGDAGNYSASYSLGIRPAFKIGNP